MCAPQTKGGASLQVCSAPDAPLGGRYRARDLTFTFENGRLARIAFWTSIDGFNYAAALLKKDFGEPRKIVRDDVKLRGGADYPHVLMTWENGRSTITLNDPAASPLDVSVQMSLDAAKAALAAPNA